MSDNRITRDGEAGWGWIVGYAALAVLIRLAPRYFALSEDFQWLWNFTAVGALGLFAGARLSSWKAFLVPLGVMLVSDLLLIRPLARVGEDAFTWTTPVLYLSLTLNVAIGRMLRSKSWPVWTVPSALLMTAQFFVASNLAEWAFGGLYARTFAGLGECFVAAVPFFRGTLIGDLVYSVLFFGLFAAAQAVAQRQKVSQPA